MPRTLTNPDDKIAKAKAKIAEQQALIAKAESIKKQQEKADTRRRYFLIGQAILERGSDELKKLVMDLMDGDLTKPKDRALFGLPERPEK